MKFNEIKLMAANEKVGDLKQENELLLLQLHQVQEELEHYYLLYKEMEANGGRVDLANTDISATRPRANVSPPKLLRLIKRSDATSAIQSTDEIIVDSARYRALLAELENIKKQADAEKKIYEERIIALEKEKNIFETENIAYKEALGDTTAKENENETLKNEVSKNLSLAEDLKGKLNKLNIRNGELKSERDALQSELKQLQVQHEQTSRAAIAKDKEIDSIKNDLSIALRFQFLRESDLKELQSRYSALFENKKQQDELLIKVEERLRVAADYLQKIDYKGDNAWDQETVRKLVHSLTDETGE